MQHINDQKNSPPVQDGLIISYFGNSVSVEDPQGQVFQCYLHRNQELPVVGDEVKWQKGSSGNNTIISIVKRRSLLAKGNDKGKLKPLAANIDAIFIVMSPPPILSEYLIDRYIAAAEILKIAPCIVLNKIDLLDQRELQEAAKKLDPYKKISYPVILSSIYATNGLDTISQHLRNKTVVLVGPSGVGKSSIIAALAGDDSIRVNEVSKKGAGKHTTTATRLYHLPHHCNVIDSPGVREFNLWPVPHEALLQGFKEFDPFKNLCKFRNCMHLEEPNCVIKEAVANHQISPKRYESFQMLIQQNIKNAK